MRLVLVASVRRSSLFHQSIMLLQFHSILQ